MMVFLLAAQLGKKIADPSAWKENGIQHLSGHLSIFTFPPFGLIHWILNCVLQSQDDPCSSHLASAKWYPDLLSFFTNEPKNFPWWWNFFLQPHLQQFCHSIDTLNFQIWRLSSKFSRKEVFLRQLHKCQPVFEDLPSSIRRNR